MVFYLTKIFSNSTAGLGILKKSGEALPMVTLNYKTWWQPASNSSTAVSVCPAACLKHFVMWSAEAFGNISWSSLKLSLQNNSH